MRCVSSQKREDIRKLVHAFLQTPSMTLCLAEPAVYPLAIINLSPEYNYMLSPMRLSSKTLDLGVGSEDPPQIDCLCNILNVSIEHEIQIINIRPNHKRETPSYYIQ